MVAVGGWSPDDEDDDDGDDDDKDILEPLCGVAGLEFARLIGGEGGK